MSLIIYTHKSALIFSLTHLFLDLFSQILIKILFLIFFHISDEKCEKCSDPSSTSPYGTGSAGTQSFITTMILTLLLHLCLT